MFVSYRLSASSQVPACAELERSLGSVGCDKFYSNNALFFASAPGFFVSATSVSELFARTLPLALARHRFEIL